MSKDEVFRHTEAKPGSFRFDAAVAKVFADMARRSIPGYEATIAAIESLARRYVRQGTHCYDLGCSLGAATLAMRRGIRVPDCEIVAVDLAQAMVDRCRELVATDDSATPVTVKAGDVRDVPIGNASMVVLNYTLQFLPVADRLPLITRIFDGMIEGGVFVLSEKIVDEDPQFEALIANLHHEFKRTNAYSDLEISRKRTALEKVLIPEAAGIHIDRLKSAGFRHAGIWLKHLNFASFVAIR